MAMTTIMMVIFVLVVTKDNAAVAVTPRIGSGPFLLLHIIYLPMTQLPQLELFFIIIIITLLYYFC